MLALTCVNALRKRETPVAGRFRGVVVRAGSAVPVGDPALGQVVGGHLDVHPVARQHPDAVLAHPAGRVGYDLVSVLKLHSERCIRQQLGDEARKLEELLFRHVTSWRPLAGTERW